MKTKNKLATFVFLVFMAFAKALWGQEATTLHVGQPAPYAGTLLSPPAVAKIIADKSECERRVVYEANFAAAKASLETGYQKDLLIASVNRDLELQKVALKSSQEQVKAEQSKNGQTWLKILLATGVGVITGAVIGGTVVLLAK